MIDDGRSGFFVGSRVSVVIPFDAEVARVHAADWPLDAMGVGLFIVPHPRIAAGCTRTRQTAPEWSRRMVTG